MILLARHGETDDNRPPVRMMGSRDLQLNERGREQARELAAAVAEAGLRALWSSHLVRAVETASFVAAALGLGEPKVDPRLAESRRGSWEGRLEKEIAREEPEAWAGWREARESFRFPGGGESLVEHRERVLAAIEEVAAGPRPALVVCHGGTIRCAVSYLRDGRFEPYNRLPVRNAVPIPLDRPYR